MKPSTDIEWVNIPPSTHMTTIIHNIDFTFFNMLVLDTWYSFML